MRLTRRQVPSSADRGLPQVICLRLTVKQWWWYTMEACASALCCKVMPRSVWKPSTIIRQQLAKAVPSALLSWHCVFEDKDNCVKFLLNAAVIEESRPRGLSPSRHLHLSCCRWWSRSGFCSMQTYAVTGISHNPSNLNVAFKIPLGYLGLLHHWMM